MGFKSFASAALACAAAALVLTACERQAAKPARTEAAASDASASVDDRAARKAERREARQGRRGGGEGGDDAGVGGDSSVRWAFNRRNTAQENLDRQFRRNGSDFGASSAEDYADKANAFISKPPAGVKTATRGNGDKLYYDPASNTFAVTNRRGYPKSYFKPEEGAAYWQEQLAKLDEYGRGRRNRQARGEGSGSDDNG